MEKEVITTKIGSIVIYIKNNKAVKIEFLDQILPEIKQSIFTKQIKEYLLGKRKKLTFPVEISGGKTFKKVWNFVRQIPYGKTMTYGEIAKKVGTTPRVVGFAMSKNPLPLYIPCHRVVGKNDIHGFTGGITWKKFLLELEENNQ